MLTSIPDGVLIAPMSEGRGAALVREESDDCPHGDLLQIWLAVPNRPRTDCRPQKAGQKSFEPDLGG